METIAAIITPPGVGAIGVIRLSGPDSMAIADKIFKGKKLARQPSHTIHFGKIIDTSIPSPDQQVNGSTIDEVVISLYKNPHSYTGEDVVEISCHGSSYILQKVLDLCLSQGAQLARPGEFTQRAFLNGKLDLTQAEAVADLIAGESKAAHDTAMHQLRGGFSNDLKAMREELIHFSALIELELDFSQEDVEFADRKQLLELLQRINVSTDELINSFQLGNAVKNGVSVAIIGAPNAGKSTLLNALLNEERAIVSEIAGTTRDTIEEVLNITGILFRFIDTAGIREHTSDVIEQKGIERSLQKAGAADIVIHLLDGQKQETSMQHHAEKEIVVINKNDLLKEEEKLAWQKLYPQAVCLSAAKKEGIDLLKQRLEAMITSGKTVTGNTIITNTRHHSLLLKIKEEIDQTMSGMKQNLPGDLLSHHIRQALHHIGELTGEVQVDRDILGAIFGKFCIGK